jgi:anti-anti-sigma factor
MPVEKWSDSVVVVHLADDPQFTDEFQDLDQFIAAAPNRPNIVLDFGAVLTINSSNLARMLKLRKSSLTGDRRLILCNVSTHVLSTLLMTGLDNVFEMSQNVSTALATLEMSRR